nr:putative ribonuclease H-like domain-containing protein [Tanacetum cinerariifolium]
ADECILWNRRLGHLNVKTMNKLVRHKLVRGLPTKSFNNDHTCTACLKGKQHKASCKSKLVNSVTKPLHTLHMDLFSPTSVSSISHKWYCLVVTDYFSRFTWTFFLRIKDETSDILKKFITEIKNLKEYKVKIIRVLVNKSQNKTTYELFNGRAPAIGFLKPFGCHVMILNTLDNLGKFEAKGDEDSMSLDDLYNHIKVYEAEVQKKSNSNSQDMAFISSSKNSSNEDGNTICVTTASTAFPTGSVNVAIISQDTASAYIAS